jgi:hypothetical protein
MSIVEQVVREVQSQGTMLHKGMDLEKVVVLRVVEEEADVFYKVVEETVMVVVEDVVGVSGC